MEEHNGRYDNLTRRVSAKGVVMAMKRSIRGARDTIYIVK